MRHHRIMKAWWIALIFTLCSVSSVRAFPPLPSSFYGTVQQGGENIPDSTLVEALIGGKVVAYTLSETYQGGSVYSLDIPGDDPSTEKVEGGTSGQTIQFRVGGVLAGQTAQWTSGVNKNLDLTLSTGKVLAPTLPTFTPAPSQTPIPKATITANTTQAAGTDTEGEALTAEADPTNTQMDQEVQSEYGTNPTEMNGELSEDAAVVAAASSDEMEADTDSIAVISEADQEGTEKNSTALWIGLPLLLLVCALAVVFVLRRKHGNDLDSSLL